MVAYACESSHAHATPHLLPDKVNTAVTDFFVEEVLDWSEEEEGANEDEGSTTREPSETTADMLSWHRADASLAHAQSTLPPMLAALRALQADPRTFHGKPIVGVAAVNVNNKHEGYAYTWASLGGLLAGWIWLSGRGRGRGGGRR